LIEGKVHPQRVVRLACERKNSSLGNRMNVSHTQHNCMIS